MGWIVCNEEVVVEDSTGEEIAKAFGSSRGEKLSRTCLMAAAPDLFGALADMVMHARKNFPPELQSAVSKAEETLNEVRLSYEREWQTIQSRG